MRVMRAAAIVGAVLVAGCGTFEDPAIVIDLRPLAMVASPPEQLLAYDPTMPPDPAKLHLVPVDVCALIADPGAMRGLEYTMTACPPTGDDRCDPADPSVLVGGGTIEDPDTAPTPQPACARLEPSAALLQVVRQTIIDDPLNGFSSVDIQVVMRINPPGGTSADAVWAAKAVRFGTQDPPDRKPNQNPTLTEIDWEPADAAPGSTPAMPLPLGRCADGAPGLDVAAGTTIHLTPIEPPGARETYVVPTFNGAITTLTENLSYDWYAGAGEWDSASTGGKRDGFGNEPDLDT
jgi:hypothetical protein